jgi:pyruvate/2-oxoglutarate dehydrogenase complex dihydrolipoamide dehydrogenase (E3) component
VNPLVGTESLPIGEPQGDRRKKKSVVVAGAGPAGITAALCAADLGYQVRLFEAGPAAGGMLWSTENAPFKKDLFDYLYYLAQSLQRPDIEFLPSTKLEPQELGKLNAEILINAIGSLPRMPEIPGNLPYTVMEARECLKKLGHEQRSWSEALIIGGGTAGCEIGLGLSLKGCRVRILEQRDDILADLDPNSAIALRHLLQQHGIQVHTRTCYKRLEPSGVLTADGIWQADIAVFALGSVPNRELDEQLPQQAWREGDNYLRVGDVNRIGKLYDAVHDTFWRVTSFLNSQGE